MQLISIMSYKTEQEAFWAGTFGNDYIQRNQSEEYLASNLNFFSKIFQHTDRPASLIEFGANIGMNLKAIQMLFPGIALSAIEINEKAADELRKLMPSESVFNESILDYTSEKQHDVSLIKGVLIHINPEVLPQVYEKLYRASRKYILVCEYYNPSPVVINYRGHQDRLFKRDFAGEMMETYPDLRLVDYGFVYRRDRSFPQDDVTWFLMEKK
jgi:pseudaminic acid biosynthesis-associated methylase